MVCPKCSKKHDVPSNKIPYPSNEGHFLCPDCRAPLGCSSDTIRGISADKVLIDDAEQTFKDKIKQAITDIIGEDRPFMVVSDIAEEVTQNVMGIIEQSTQGACEHCRKPENSPICASARKEVVVTVTGGVAYVEEIPPGIIVKIRDYDIEGCDEDKLMQDKEGNRYIEAVLTEDDMSYVGDDDDGDPY